MSRIFIGLGSNEGDRLGLLSKAIHALGTRDGVHVVQLAMVIETEPVSGIPQGPYLNTVVELETTLSPRELLRVLQLVERDLGRRPSIQRWGPRPIDLDLLLYGDRIIQEPDLQVPHPRMHERRFVLEPLAQLAPDLIHPLLGAPIETLRRQLFPSELGTCR
jgi:2-amino-4-hydroxy-6-hydroxymethyldihydropteridine diphosphokinase